MLYSKPANMPYTDLAIWVDQHKDLNCDTETFFNYIYALCDMIARKKKWFQYEDEREDFSCYFAVAIYNKYEKKQDVPSSILNYIKSVAGYKKVDYTREQWQQNITPAVLPQSTDTRYDYTHDDAVIQSQIPFLRAEFNEYLRSIPRTIKCIVDKNFTGMGYLQKTHITQSCMLSLLNLITLPIRVKDRVYNIQRSEYVRECLIKRLYSLQRDSDWKIYFRLSDEERPLLDKIMDIVIATIVEDIQDMISEISSLCAYANDIKNDFLTKMLDDEEYYGNEDDESFEY